MVDLKKYLKAEDLSLWQNVKDTTKPFSHNTVIFNKQPYKNKQPQHPQGFQFEKNYAPPQPKETYYCLKINSRGLRKVKPEATIDLHGYTLLQAEEALEKFILKSYYLGQRWVLVITGKGHHSKENDNNGHHNLQPAYHQFTSNQTIRAQTVKWLGDNLSLVLGFSAAPLNQGGAGAFYVNLRRNK